MKSHIDTRLLVIDDDVAARLRERTEPPDANGCMFYSEQFRKHIILHTRDGELQTVSTLRVAMVVAGRGDLSHDEEAIHVSCKNNGTCGKRLCVNPDHLDIAGKVERRRLMMRGAHRARMNRSFRGAA